MPTKSIEDIVADRINEDKQTITSIAAQLKDSASVEVTSFFPELPSSVRPSNLPGGVPLWHQIILGPPTVFDLEPVSPDEFRRRYGITIAIAENLVERGILIPNLYFRQPSDWRGMDHFAGLIKRAFVNGERVDAYFRVRDGRYDTLLDEHTASLEALMAELKKKSPDRLEALLKSVRCSRERAPHVFATRWTYLDVLAPYGSEYFAALISEAKIEEAFDFLRITKHAFVSPTTAAIGGNYIWGPKDIARLVKVEGSFPEAVTFLPESWHYKHPERLNFLLRHLSGVEPFQILSEFQSERVIMRLCENRNLAQTKQMFFEVMDTMSELAEKGEVKEDTVQSWVQLHEEIRREIGGLEKEAKTGASAIVGVSVGLFLESGVVAVGAGAIANAIASNYIDSVGSKILRFASPTRHRFHSLLNQL